MTELQQRARKAEQAVTGEQNRNSDNVSRITRENWHWSGWGTPEASFQTTVWAMSNGDLESLLASSTPEARENFKKQFDGKSNEEIETALKAEVEALPAIRLDRKKELSSNEVSFTLNMREQDDGTTRLQDEAIMRLVFTGQAWLLAM